MWGGFPPSGWEESVAYQSADVGQDADGWFHRESLKEHCLFCHGTSLSTWLFSFLLRIHMLSSNTAKTLAHSPDKSQPASFLL